MAKHGRGSQKKKTIAKHKEQKLFCKLGKSFQQLDIDHTTPWRLDQQDHNNNTKRKLTVDTENEDFRKEFASLVERQRANKRHKLRRRNKKKATVQNLTSFGLSSSSSQPLWSPNHHVRAMISSETRNNNNNNNPFAKLLLCDDRDDHHHPLPSANYFSFQPATFSLDHHHYQFQPSLAFPADETAIDPDL